MSIHEYTNEMVNVNKSTEVSTNVHTGGSDYDYLMNLLENKTREYTFMTFDDFRISLGKNEWGKKLFFDTMTTMNILCKTPKGYRVLNPDKPNMVNGEDIGYASNSSYAPCPEGARKYPKLFVYDQTNLIWGFNGKMLHLIDDDFIAKMNEIAEELKEMYAEEKRIARKLSALKQKTKRRVNGNDSK